MSTPQAFVESTREPSWRDTGESEHFVQFYDDDAYLLDSVAGFIGDGLDCGMAGIVVATRPHLDRLEQCWRSNGVDIDAARERGQYVALDAAAALNKLLLDGWPQKRRFAAVIGSIVAHTRGRYPRVRIFGEMVALLCEEGRHDAASRLEELWNDLSKRHPFALMCAYPMREFNTHSHAESLANACGAHTRIIPTESYTSLSTPSDRSLAIARLQQQAQALAREVQVRREVEQALREADRRKDEFLATLAHELRNPLAPIRNAVEIMRMAGADGGAVTSAQQLMERQLKQLVRLIDDLLDVSRITQGHLELRKERMDLAIAVQMALETSRPSIESKQHHVEIVWPPEPLFVDADATRIAQVFANLLNNSAKYSPPRASIRVALARHADHGVVTVSDTGIGIPANMLLRVFDMFTRVSRGPEAVQDGLGIGLTLVKRLVELHGGEIEAHSEGTNCGSTFTVKLPLSCSSATADELPPRDGAHVSSGGAVAAQHRILIADDNRDSAMSLAMLLSLDGHDVRRAHDGIEALEVAEAFHPDVVLLDIGMPRLDGYGAARELRKRPWADRVQLFALTGWGQNEDKQRARAAGFDHHLVKPVDPSVLRGLLNRNAPSR